MKDKAGIILTNFYLAMIFFLQEPRAKQEGRGGNRIVRLKKKDGVHYGKRDMYSGSNLPGYPSAAKAWP